MSPMNNRLLRPLASGGFSPKRIAGLAAWYDASVTSSLTLVSGFVSQWNDLSGVGPNLAQGTEASRPGTATINGRNAVDFDGSNDFLFTATELADFATVFDVHLLDAGVAYGLYELNSTVGGSAKRMSLIYSQALAEYRATAVTGVTSTPVSGGTRTASPRVASFSFGSPVGVRLDGAALSGTTSVTSGNQAGIYLGVRNINGSTSLPLDGKIGEVIIYDRALSSSEIATVEKYLAQKWGVTLA